VFLITNNWKEVLPYRPLCMKTCTPFCTHLASNPLDARIYCSKFFFFKYGGEYSTKAVLRPITSSPKPYALQNSYAVLLSRSTIWTAHEGAGHKSARATSELICCHW